LDIQLPLSQDTFLSVESKDCVRHTRSKGLSLITTDLNK
jgi:hypothetical protein